MIFRSNSNRKEREYNPLIYLTNKRWTYGHTCICGCCMPVLGIRFLFSPLDITNTQTRILTHRNPRQNENTTSHYRRGRRSMHSSLRKSYQFSSNLEWSMQSVKYDSIVAFIHLDSHLMAKPLDPVRPQRNFGKQRHGMDIAISGRQLHIVPDRISSLPLAHLAREVYSLSSFELSLASSFIARRCPESY